MRKVCLYRQFGIEGAHTPWMALDPEAGVPTGAGEAHRRGPEKMEPEQRPR